MDYDRIGEIMSCPDCNSIMYFDQLEPLSPPIFRCAECNKVISAIGDNLDYVID